jgi:CubicO group peptidase (beta-lactamase class C family)
MTALGRANRWVAAAILAAAAIFCAEAAPGRADAIADRFPAAAWEHADAAATGWSAEKLKRTEEWSRKIGSTAVMIIHHGAVVAEWGDTAVKTPLASVRKSLLSALYGIAVERGQIRLSQSMAARHRQADRHGGL